MNYGKTVTVYLQNIILDNMSGQIQHFANIAER